MDQAQPDYLVIGHVTRDLIPGGWRFGGTVTFSALVAQKLGMQVGVLTSSAVHSNLSLVPNIRVVIVPSENDTVFENIYTPAGRTQYLRSVAQPLTPADLPAAWRQVPIFHLGPVAQEVSPQFVDHHATAITGVTPQGWLRRWEADGRVYPTTLDDAERILGSASCVVLSLEDLGGDQKLLDTYIGMSKLLVQTCGLGGSIVYSGGTRINVPAYDVVEVDPTGAGDVFATAFFIRYYETQDPVQAAQYGNCVASFVVEGPGTSTIPTREQVNDRLLKGTLRTNR